VDDGISGDGLCYAAAVAAALDCTRVELTYRLPSER
jgi:hypothetical protein